MPLLTDAYREIFTARRIKQPELRPLDRLLYQVRGWWRHRWPHGLSLQRTINRVNRLEQEFQNLSDRRFREEISTLQGLARRQRLSDEALERSLAASREGVEKGGGQTSVRCAAHGRLGHHPGDHCRDGHG
jgi:hypothetical protein